MTDNRRPIASRDTRLAARVARWLADSSVTPNQISQASMIFALLAGGCFWGSGLAEGIGRAALLVLAALGCQGRLLCNLFDGMVAVEGGKGAADGPYWNEAPDRVADILIFVGIGLGAGWPALGWAAACFAVLTAYVRELRASNGLGADFSGPMAKPHRMAVTTGAAVLAILWPPVLVWVLWLVAVGAAATSARRSWRMIRALKASRPVN